jgi:hypothetical protein
VLLHELDNGCSVAAALKMASVLHGGTLSEQGRLRRGRPEGGRKARFQRLLLPEDAKRLAGEAESEGIRLARHRLGSVAEPSCGYRIGLRLYERGGLGFVARPRRLLPSSRKTPQCGEWCYLRQRSACSTLVCVGPRRAYANVGLCRQRYA